MRRVEQSSRRSVDSQRPGSAIEPRKCLLAGALVFAIRGGHAASPPGAWCARSDRGLRTGHRCNGHPRNLRDPGPLHSDHSGRRPDYQLQAPGLPSGLRGAKPQTHRVVSPSEGNEARREGGRESERSIVTAVGGTAPEGTPAREGSACSSNRWRETCQVHRNLIPCQRDNNG